MTTRESLVGLVERLRLGASRLHIRQTEAQPLMREAATALEEQSREIERLRGLLIDPGDPAWEDARGILAAELRKAEMPGDARAVADGEGAYIPSWMALNLIAQAARTALSPSKTVEKGEGE